MRRTSRISLVAALAAVFSMLFANFAFASELDSAVLDIDTSEVLTGVTLSEGEDADFTIELTITGRQSQSASFKIKKDWTLEDGVLTGAGAETISVPIRAQGADATVLTRTGSVTIAEDEPNGGPYTLSIAPYDVITGGQGTLNVSGGATSFDVTVLNPVVTPTNSAPAVAMSGVTDGASYEAGAVPIATCDVTDVEDGNSNHRASLSEITGDDAAYGVGTQTATCDYTDEADAPAPTATATYSIVDTTAPSLSNLPANITEEATSASGATATWTAPTAVGRSGEGAFTSCTPASGATFGLGSNTVSCTAADALGNVSTPAQTFTVNVVDTTDPVLTVPASPVTAEATGPNGADVTFTTSATDAVTASPTIDCTPASGALFSMGTTQVSCTAVDAAGNRSAAQVFDVTVADATAPQASISIDGNDWTNNRNITVDLTATDAVGVTGYRIAESQSGLTGAFTAINPADDDYSLDNLAVELSDSDAEAKDVWVQFTDAAGNKVTASDSVGLDRVAPAVLNENGGDANYTLPGWTNAASVSHTFTSSDELSGLAAGTPASFTLTLSAQSTKDSAGSVVATTDSGTVFDRAGNSTTRSFSARIDRTNPVNQISGPTDGGTYALGSAIPAAACSTTDALSGTATTATASAVDNSTVGSKTVTCSGGTDNAGNSAASVSRTYSVVYNWTGFFQPVDNNGVFNKVKAGSAVPVKFSLSGNQGLGIFDTITTRRIACPNTMVTDTLETLAAGTTSGLKYDSLADQYNYTWKTGSGLAGTCQRLELTLNDGTLHTANFNFTK